MDKKFRLKYIDFYEYPPYSGIISEILKQMLMMILSVIMATLILQVNRKCAHWLMRKVGE